MSKKESSAQSSHAVSVDGAEENSVSRGGKAPIPSHDVVRVPFYREADGPVPEFSARIVLNAVGLAHTRPLSLEEAQRVIKTPEDFTTVADNVLVAYRRDYQILSLKDFPVEQYEALLARVQYLEARAGALLDAAQLADHQLRIARADLYDASLRIRRRVIALSEEEPELLGKWGFFETYVSKIFPGRGNAAAPTTPAVGTGTGGDEGKGGKPGDDSSDKSGSGGSGGGEKK